jgi:hypothetical protein
VPEGIKLGTGVGRLPAMMRGSGKSVGSSDTMRCMSAPTLTDPRVLRRALRDGDENTRRKHGRHAEIERKSEAPDTYWLIETDGR